MTEENEQSKKGHLFLTMFIHENALLNQIDEVEIVCIDGEQISVTFLKFILSCDGEYTKMFDSLLTERWIKVEVIPAEVRGNIDAEILNYEVLSDDEVKHG